MFESCILAGTEREELDVPLRIASIKEEADRDD